MRECYLSLRITITVGNWIDHYLRQDNPSIGHHSKGNDTESPIT